MDENKKAAEKTLNDLTAGDDGSFPLLVAQATGNVKRAITNAGVSEHVVREATYWLKHLENAILHVDPDLEEVLNGKFEYVAEDALGAPSIAEDGTVQQPDADAASETADGKDKASRTDKPKRPIKKK